MRLELILPNTIFGIRLKEPGVGYWNAQLRLWLATIVFLKVHICTGVNQKGDKDRMIWMGRMGWSGPLVSHFASWNVHEFSDIFKYLLESGVMDFRIGYPWYLRTWRVPFFLGQSGVEINHEIISTYWSRQHKSFDPELIIPIPIKVGDLITN